MATKDLGKNIENKHGFLAENENGKNCDEQETIVCILHRNVIDDP